MTLTLLPLSEQTVVITGASSGIGLATARTAARHGARVVLAARNAAELRRIVDDIRREGGRAIDVVTDVSDEAHVERLADRACAEFGRIDTWVNTAAVSLHGRIMEVPSADFRRQMAVNYWGQIYGSRAAVRRMRERGGALVNVALADRARAASDAVKAFTDALRIELADDGVPIAVTLVTPASVNTRVFEKVRTSLGLEPQSGPVYAPEMVSGAILEAATRPIREVRPGRAVAAAGLVMAAAALAAMSAARMRRAHVRLKPEATYRSAAAAGRRDS